MYKTTVPNDDVSNLDPNGVMVYNDRPDGNYQVLLITVTLLC